MSGPLTVLSRLRRWSAPRHCLGGDIDGGRNRTDLRYVERNHRRPAILPINLGQNIFVHRKVVDPGATLQNVVHSSLFSVWCWLTCPPDSSGIRAR